MRRNLSVLMAELIDLEVEIREKRGRADAIRAQLGLVAGGAVADGAGPAPTRGRPPGGGQGRKKRTLSPAARAAIGAATRKRWADYRSGKIKARPGAKPEAEAPAEKPRRKKRQLSEAQLAAMRKNAALARANAHGKRGLSPQARGWRDRRKREAAAKKAAATAAAA